MSNRSIECRRHVELEATLRLALEELENCADLLKVFEAPVDSCIGAAMLGAENAVTAIKEALMSQSDGAQPEQEPVGVTQEQRRLIGVIAEKIEDGTLFQSGIYSRKDLARFVRNMLDTQPPKRKPLTDQQIKEITLQLGWSQLSVDDCKFARAIEAAHGIHPTGFKE